MEKTGQRRRKSAKADHYDQKSGSARTEGDAYYGYPGEFMSAILGHPGRNEDKVSERLRATLPHAPENDLVFVLSRPGFLHNRASIRQNAQKLSG
jgi:hypothetical protein